MKRRDFLESIKSASMLTLAGSLISGTAHSAKTTTSGIKKHPAGKVKAPLAITMWDFSWLERRWDGAGYQDWDLALDGLVERGYNAVRIDAYPHLVAADPNKEWLLYPHWNTQLWGSPDVNRVRVFPSLPEFIEKCHQRHIKVALSSWYREDADNTRMNIDSPEMMAENWLKTLDLIKKAGLIDAIWYVDLCNEWPLDLWCPWFTAVPKGSTKWKTPESIAYMQSALNVMRNAYPDIPLGFSFCNNRVEDYLDQPMTNFDYFDHHIWMVQQNGGEFYKQVGYGYERFDPKGYTAMSLKAERIYRERENYWRKLVLDKISRTATISRKTKTPLVTTEGWAVVDYKDWPLLDWGWVKELNAECVKAASATGQWAAISTSNFCGPQFVGMWSDIQWHQNLTNIIKSGPLNSELKTGRLWDRT